MPKVIVMPVIGAQGEQPIVEVYWLFCPACLDHVRITSDFGFDGNLDNPTFESPIYTVIHDKVCHATISGGVWHYQGDCTHELANTDVPMTDVPAFEGVDSAHV